MKRDKLLTNLFKLGLVLVDIILVVLGIYITYMLKFNFHPPRYNYEPFIETVPFTVVVYFVFMYIYGLLDVLKKSLSEIIYSIGLTVIMMLVFNMAIAFLLRGFSYPRTVILFSVFFQFVFLSIWRTIVWKINRKMHGKKPVLVIGDSNAEHIAKKILLKQKDIYYIKYICGSNCENVKEYIKDVEMIIICDDVDATFKNFVLDVCMSEQKSLFILPTMSEIALLGAKVSQVDDVPLLEMKPLGLTIEQKFVKRLIDIVVAMVGIIIASPIMIITALIIKLTDGGNVFYKQERVTEGERTFNVIKFRSMVVNAEKITGPTLATENDPRITKIGRIVRATRIDELPQLFNILNGDMSVVGPRPERPFYVKKFKEEIDDYKYRTVVKAGLTGYAQVFGKYNTTPEDKVRYDIMYIKNYSLFKDFKLILQTIKIIFMKESTEGFKDDEESLDKIIEDMDLKIKIDKD